MAVRLHLFCGTDSYASLQQVQAWVAHFNTKYSGATRYLLEADELSPSELQGALANYLTAQTLFPEPTLILVKRLSEQDSAGRTTASTAILGLVEQVWGQVSPTTTLVFWEERDFSSSHPLRESFARLQEDGVAKLHVSSLPGEREIGRWAERQLATFNCTLDPAAATWLRVQYRYQEQSVRLVRRLKATEPLLQDERGWWLRQLLATAALRASGGLVQVSTLEDGYQTAAQPVSVFEVAQAFTDQQWEACRDLVTRFVETNGEAGFFGLLGALRWQLQRGRNRFTPPTTAYTSRLLDELELLLRNTTLQPTWLFDVLLERVAGVALGGEHLALIQPRKLWLSQLPRS